MKNCLISVIIPAYNCEQHIERCIRSLMAQTHQQLEIIVVDDGASDQTPQICDSLAEEDCRITVHHQKNGGVSSARNAGLKRCHGEYISFMDSDDYAEPQMYELLLQTLFQHKTKVAMCEYLMEEDSSTRIAKISENTVTISSQQLMKDIFTYKYMGVLWNKLFRKDIFINNNIFFDESICFCEDILLLTKISAYCPQVALCKKPLYHYVIYPDSLCHGKMNLRKLSIIKAVDRIMAFCSENLPELLPYAKYFSITNKMTIYDNLVTLKQEEDYIEYIQQLKQDMTEIAKKSKFKTKIKIYTAIYFPKTYMKLKQVKSFVKAETNQEDQHENFTSDFMEQ
ncbi:MAG: glycosyltransferase [Oscillospiraceae bacterium]|nr:glycosyltransferase [Oscillospiraceae bacterium]